MSFCKANVYRNLLTCSSKLSVFKIAFNDKLNSDFDFYMIWDNRKKFV